MERNEIATNLVMNYSSFCQEMFMFLKGRVFGNMIFSKNAILEIHLFEPATGILAKCIYPNKIQVFIGDILAMFSMEDINCNFEVTDSCVKSVITQTLIHELLHMNKLPDMNAYNTSREAHEAEEIMIDRQSVLILMDIKNDIENTFGFDFRLDIFMSAFEGPYSNNGYGTESYEEYYIKSIINIFQPLRYNELKELFSVFKNVTLFIKMIDNPMASVSIPLKINGTFDNLATLSQFQNSISFMSMAENMHYKIYFGSNSNNTVGYISIEISDVEIYPMVFKE